MDSKKLRLFISAAYSLNFSEVAKNNFLSQPAVSRQIDMLEQELGAKLFLRNGKKLTLSNEGEYFLPSAVKLLGDMQNTADDMKQYCQGNHGKLRVLVSETNIDAYWNCVLAFSKRHSGVLIDTHFHLFKEQVDAMTKGTHDVFFVFEEMVKAHDKYDYLTLQQDQVCLALPSSIEPVDNIDDFSFVKNLTFLDLFAEGTSIFKRYVSDIFNRRDFSPQTVFRFNKLQELLVGVERGLGFAIVPYSVALDSNRDVTVIPFPNEEYKVNRVLAWRKDNHRQEVEQFKKVVYELYGK